MLWKAGSTSPPIFSGSKLLPLPLPMRTRLCVLRVLLSTFDSHNGSWFSSFTCVKWMTFLKTVFCWRSIWRLIIPFLCYSALDSNGCHTLRFVVSDKEYFSFQKGIRTCDDSCVLNYSSTFASILRGWNTKGIDFLLGKQLLKCCGTSKYLKFFFICLGIRRRHPISLKGTSTILTSIA